MKTKRINFRLDADLVNNFQQYARRHRVSMTVLMEEYLLDLLAKEKEQEERSVVREVEPAEQI